ncbi:MAG: DUF2887 domain-containing protein [Pseudanabaenaceae cyanobacterium]
MRKQHQKVMEPTRQRLLLDLMETVLVYKFTHLRRKEIAAMFGFSE